MATTQGNDHTISETIAVAFEKILGPTVGSFLSNSKSQQSGFKDF